MQTTTHLRSTQETCSRISQTQWEQSRAGRYQRRVNKTLAQLFRNHCSTVTIKSYIITPLGGTLLLTHDRRLASNSQIHKMADLNLFCGHERRIPKFISSLHWFDLKLSSLRSYALSAPTSCHCDFRFILQTLKLQFGNLSSSFISLVIKFKIICRLPT